MTTRLSLDMGGSHLLAATEEAVQTLSRNALKRKTSSPSTSEVSSSRSQLQAAVVDRKADLNTLMVDNHDRVAQHLNQSHHISTESKSIEHAVRAVEQDFRMQDAKNDSGLSEFLKHSAIRSSSGKDAAIAAATVSALKDIQLNHESLSRIEDAIWFGRGIDPTVLQSLLSVVSDSTDVSSHVLTAIKQRMTLLRSTVSEQVAKAWSTIVAVSTTNGDPVMAVRREVRLQLPTTSRATNTLTTNNNAASPPSYRLSELAAAMSKLGILSKHLHILHSQILELIVEPVLRHRSTQVVTDHQEGTSSLRLRSHHDQSPLDTVDSLKTLLSFVRTEVCTSPCPPEIESFGLQLQQDIFARVHSTLLITSIPSSSSLLPQWISLVHACSAWEVESLGTSNGILDRFAKQEAGDHWLAKFRDVRLRHARCLSFQEWAVGDLLEVELPETEQSSNQNPLVPTPSSQPLAPKAINTTSDTAMEQDSDGWGFDDDQPPPATSDLTSSGWDFDDATDTLSKPQAVAPKPKQPVREAKRLGKRVKSSGRDSPKPVLAPSPSPSPPPPPSLKAVKPPPPAPTVVATRPVYHVSSACNAVLQLPSKVLKEMEMVKTFDEPSFHHIPQRMVDVLTEELDFICATTPVARQLRSGRSVSAPLQLGNEYLYIASQLDSTRTDEAWPGKIPCAERFRKTGALLHRMCFEEHLAAINALLDGARHLVEMGHENFFAQAEEAVGAAVSLVESLAVDVQPILTPEQYQTLVGNLVEAMIVRVLGEIFALDDITEIESSRIVTILNRIESLDQLFMSGNSEISSIAAHVPHWLKFCYTSQLLAANLVDITYLFESGSLVDFKPAELSKLVQALFAESSKRAILLDKIASSGK